MNSYLGQTPVFGDFPFQILSGDGTSFYELSFKTNGTNGLLVFLNGAVQRPGIDFTCDGNALTFSENVSVGVQIFVYGMGLPKSSLAPSAGSVGDAELDAALEARIAAAESQSNFTIIYPNGGTAVSPANISANTRYVNANPFPGHPVICELQILVSGRWGTPGWWTDGSNARGAVVGQCDDEIIVQTAVSSVTAGGGSTNSGGWSGATLPGNIGEMASAPARVRVWRVKG